MIGGLVGAVPDHRSDGPDVGMCCYAQASRADVGVEPIAVVERRRGVACPSEVPPEQWTGDQAAFAAPVRDCSYRTGLSIPIAE
jgi:hypothetical protein